MGFISKITGKDARKNRENDLKRGIEELKSSTATSSQTLRDLYQNLLGQSTGELGQLERNRQAQQLALSDLINKLQGQSETQRQGLLSNLKGGIESAFSQFQPGETGLEDRLRQAITGSLGQARTGLEGLLGQKEAGITNALNQYLSGSFTQDLPEIQAALGSRGLSLQGGTAGQAIAQELAKLGGVRFNTLSDLANQRASSLMENQLREAQVRQALEGQLFGTGREDLLNRLQQSLNVGQQEFGLTREDQMRNQQMQYENYLQNLGFARQNEQQGQQFNYGLRGQQLPLEQQLQQAQLGALMPGLNLAQQNLAGAQSREGAILGGLGSLAGTFLGSYALPKLFPSTQDQFYKKLIGQMGPANPITNAGGSIIPPVYQFGNA